MDKISVFIINLIPRTDRKASILSEFAAREEFQITMVQAIELPFTYKTKVKPSQRPKITSSKEAYAILLENWDEDKLEFVEQFKVLLLNRANKVLGINEVSTGGVFILK